jgi:predicted acylesterase/phospholipase RssA
MGDLPVNSAISVSDLSALPPHADTYRLSNIKINQESNPEIDLVEALMATSAIPLIFPAAKFSDSSGLPRTSFIDGGLAEDHLPYTAVLQFEKYRQSGVDTLIIVSRKSDTQPNMNDELQDFDLYESRLSGKLGLWFEGMAKNGFLKSMKELQKNYPGLASHTFVYIPDFEENFPLLNFNNMQQQYMVTAAWASVHKPVLLSQYLAQAEAEEQKEK